MIRSLIFLAIAAFSSVGCATTGEIGRPSGPEPFWIDVPSHTADCDGILTLHFVLPRTDWTGMSYVDSQAIMSAASGIRSMTSDSVILFVPLQRMGEQLPTDPSGSAPSGVVAATFATPADQVPVPYARPSWRKASRIGTAVTLALSESEATLGRSDRMKYFLVVMESSPMQPGDAVVFDAVRHATLFRVDCK